MCTPQTIFSVAQSHTKGYRSLRCALCHFSLTAKTIIACSVITVSTTGKASCEAFPVPPFTSLRIGTQALPWDSSSKGIPAVGELYPLHLLGWPRSTKIGFAYLSRPILRKQGQYTGSLTRPLTRPPVSSVVYRGPRVDLLNPLLRLSAETASC